MNTTKLVIVKAGHEEYGLPILSVLSIEKVMEQKSIPDMPFYMTGLVKVREELIPVVDMNLVFNKNKTIISDTTKLIVVQSNQLNIGLLVDEAKEIIEVSQEEIKQVSFGAFQTISFFNGVISTDESLITIVDIPHFIESLNELHTLNLSHL